MHKDKKLPLKLVKFYAVEMIKALSYLKYHKIIHRDFKPENIMLDHHFHLRLSDFGFSVSYKDSKDKYNELNKKCEEFKKNLRSLSQNISLELEKS